MASRSAFRLCQVHLSPDDPAQTFARAHAERLPCEVVVLHGELGTSGGSGARPLYLDGVPLRSEALPRRVISGTRTAWSIARKQDVEASKDTAMFRTAFRRARCDAVLVEFGHTAVRALDALDDLDLPLVVHFHGFDAHSSGLLSRFGHRYPALFARAAAVIAVSYPMRDALIALGAPDEKVHRVPYGVDTARFAGSTPDRNPPTFLGVGRFVEKKAPHLTVAAFASVYRRCPEARLRMIGDGELLGVCRDLARGFGIDDAVTFLGTQPHDDVAREMQQARAFVQHSVVAAGGDSEGMPVSVLEACASGLPVVSTRHAGIPEVVIDGETGFLVDERDVDGMARQMERLVIEPALASELGRSGRLRVEQQFTMDSSITRLWNVIQAATAAASPAS